MLMEAGASAKSVERIAQMIAQGLEAQRVELRIGYASVAITIGIDEAGITRLRRLDEIGVNQQLIQQLWYLGKRAEANELNCRTDTN